MYKDYGLCFIHTIIKTLMILYSKANIKTLTKYTVSLLPLSDGRNFLRRYLLKK